MVPTAFKDEVQYSVTELTDIKYHDKSVHKVQLPQAPAVPELDLSDVAVTGSKMLYRVRDADDELIILRRNDFVTVSAAKPKKDYPVEETFTQHKFRVQSILL